MRSSRQPGRVNPEVPLLSAVLRTGAVTEAVRLGVTPEVFHRHRAEWEWIIQAWQSTGRVPEKVAFRARWPEVQLLATDDVHSWATLLLEDHARRSLLVLTQSTIERLESGQGYQDLVAAVQADIMRLSGHTLLRPETDLADCEDLVNEVCRRAERRREGSSPGVPFGLPSLDELTGGAMPGRLIIFSARLGQGKTWLALHTASSAAMAGHRVLFVSLEMSRSEVAVRLLSLLARMTGIGVLSPLDMERGTVDLELFQEVTAGVHQHIPGQVLLNDSSRRRVSPAELAIMIERSQPDLVIVDYFSLLRAERPGWEGLEALSGDLKAIAQRFGVPLLLPAQVNRAGVTKGTDVAGTEFLAGTDALGRDADLVVGVKEVSRHLRRLEVTKNRHGYANRGVWVRFAPEWGLIEEVSASDAETIQEADREEEGE